MLIKPIDSYIELQKLFEYRNLNLELINELPAIGYGAWHNDRLAAAGFLRLMEGGYSMIDGLISNLCMLSEVRHEALDEVVKSLITHAKMLNLKKILAFSVDTSTLLRAKRHGFEQLPDSFIVLNLSTCSPI